MSYEHITASSPEATSGDVTADNLQALTNLFPDVVRDGQVDVDILKQLIGDNIVEGEERFGLNWRGKAEARRAALTPSLGTLRPSKEDSVDWDSTKNLYIEGDNLEVLKLLRKSYSGKVEMIYIDPPYNTGKDFIYEDDYREGISAYKAATQHEYTYKVNQETNGRYHSNWLNMIYPRLLVAKELLASNGIIFISIDDHEQGTLKTIANEIFGEENFVGCFLWNKTSKAPTLSDKIRNKYEYVYCYQKSISRKLKGKDSYNTHGPLFNSGNAHTLRTIPAGHLMCQFPDGEYRAGEYGEQDKKVILHDDLVVKNGKNIQDIRITGRFKWTQDTINEYCLRGFNFLYKTNTFITLYYDLLWDGQGYIAPSDIINKSECEVETNDEAHDALAHLFGGLSVFDHPKPVSLLRYLVSMLDNKEGIYMDFFSGSGTLAHAIMDMNVVDNGTRRYICIQLPEQIKITPSMSAASKKIVETAIQYLEEKGKPCNICEIAKQRITKVINTHQDALVSEVDLGFRVYKLDSSNVKAWNPHAEDLATAVNNYAEHLIGGRTEEDFLTEIMLKSGIDLVEEVAEREIAGHRVQSLGYGQYYACMAADLAEDAEEVALGIAAWHAEDCAVAGGEQQDTCTVFVSDRAFESNDAAKMNFVAILEQHGICNIKAL